MYCKKRPVRYKSAIFSTSPNFSGSPSSEIQECKKVILDVQVGNY